MNMRLKTSDITDAKLDEMHRSLKLSSKAVLARIAIAYSLKIPKNPLNNKKFNVFSAKGFEFNRITLTGDKDDAIKALIIQHLGRYISDDEYYPKYIRAHIERGIFIIYSKFKKAGNRKKFFGVLLRDITKKAI